VALAAFLLIEFGGQPVTAAPPVTPDVLSAAKQAVQSADFRASGHLIRIDASGNRTNYSIAVKAHWFPGVLRVFLDVSPPAGSIASDRAHVLIEMRPDGKNAVQIAHPGDKAPAALPFDKWTDGPLGSGFSYEDFTEQQYFWPTQAPPENTTYGARNCDLLKSTPGPANRTHYAQVKTWLDHSIAFPVYVEKSSKGTAPVKEFTFSGLRHDGGVWSAHQVEEKTRGQGGSTLLIIDRGSAKANLGLGDFSPEQLIRF
jgi:hypothetical protein